MIHGPRDDHTPQIPSPDDASPFSVPVLVLDCTYLLVMYNGIGLTTPRGRYVLNSYLLVPA